MRLAALFFSVCAALCLATSVQAAGIQKRVENGVTIYYGVPSAPQPVRTAASEPSYEIIIDQDYRGIDLGQNIRVLRDDQMTPLRRGARRHSCDCGAAE